MDTQSLLQRLALALAMAGSGFAQQASLRVYPPSNLYVSDVQAKFGLGGRRIVNDYPDLTVFLDGTDVTAYVGWTWGEEQRVDVNRDGRLESFVATAQLDLSALVMSHDSMLELEATTNGSLGAPVVFRAGTRVLNHAEIGLAPSRIDVGALPDELICFTTMYGVPATGVTRVIRVTKDGIDITAAVLVVERLLGAMTLPSGLVDQRSQIMITTSSLGALDEYTDLVVSFDATLPGGGTFTASAGFNLGTGTGHIPCAEEEICQFLGDMGITKAPTGELAVGTTDKSLMRAAAEDLKAGLRACQAPDQADQQYSFTDQVDCDGILIDLVLVVGGDSGSWPEPTFAGSDSVEGSLVVAIGGDGTANGTSGGTAEARAGKGSVAFAIGGTGDDKAYGGRASTLATEEDSTGIALGGRGGEGGGQGGGSFTDCENPSGGTGGQGVSGGGPGGHSGKGTAGGHGGGAGVRSNEGDYSNREGGPKEGGSGGNGQHGSGACAHADAEGHASAKKGKSLDN